MAIVMQRLYGLSYSNLTDFFTLQGSSETTVDSNNRLFKLFSQFVKFIEKKILRNFINMLNLKNV